jgi:hypothetical protein
VLQKKKKKKKEEEEEEEEEEEKKKKKKRYHSTSASYTFSFTCRGYQKNKWAKTGNLPKAMFFFGSTKALSLLFKLLVFQEASFSVT